jgi:hypothetical protein
MHKRYSSSWASIENAMYGIFERQYYTECGPLVRQLEAELALLTSFEHVIGVTNLAIAELMLLTQVPQPLCLPSQMPESLRMALMWQPCASPCFYSVDSQNEESLVAISPATALQGCQGFLLANDENCDLVEAVYYRVAQHNIPLLGVFPWNDKGVFYYAKYLSAWIIPFGIGNDFNTGGACICTRDALLANRLRTMRASSGVTQAVPVVKTVNGRMSEAQAALALLLLGALAP